MNNISNRFCIFHTVLLWSVGFGELVLESCVGELAERVDFGELAVESFIWLERCVDHMEEVFKSKVKSLREKLEKLDSFFGIQV